MKIFILTQTIFDGEYGHPIGDHFVNVYLDEGKAEKAKKKFEKRASLETFKLREIEVV